MMGKRSDIDITRLQTAIQDEYAEVAAQPTKGFHFHTGRLLAKRLRYPQERVDRLPDAVVESFAGVGNPFAWGDPGHGQTVLDQGSGAGFDAIQAAMLVGPTGHVMGIDMTPAMIDKATRNAASLGLDNIAFWQGYLEALPVADETVDVVISNGVLNLCPDKMAVLSETFRVLKPGGRYQLSDIVVSRDVGDDVRADIDLWTGWIAGALPAGALQTLLEAAGFTKIHFADHRYDAFSDAPQASSAAEFGTQGVDILAVKPR